MGSDLNQAFLAPGQKLPRKGSPQATLRGRRGGCHVGSEELQAVSGDALSSQEDRKPVPATSTEMLK